MDNSVVIKKLSDESDKLKIESSVNILDMVSNDNKWKDKLINYLEFFSYEVDDDGKKYPLMRFKSYEVQEEVKVQKNVDNIKKAVTLEETSEQLSSKSKDLFNELFGEN